MHFIWQQWYACAGLAYLHIQMAVMCIWVKSEIWTIVVQRHMVVVSLFNHVKMVVYIIVYIISHVFFPHEGRKEHRWHNFGCQKGTVVCNTT